MSCSFLALSSAGIAASASTLLRSRASSSWRMGVSWPLSEALKPDQVSVFRMSFSRSSLP